jgi:TM2 domain-containing membrane protein YozV
MKPRNPALSAALSAIIPGVGQFYNRDFWRGVFWLILTPGFWIGSGGTLGWVCHILAAYTAYTRAERKNEKSRRESADKKSE